VCLLASAEPFAPMTYAHPVVSSIAVAALILYTGLRYSSQNVCLQYGMPVCLQRPVSTNGMPMLVAGLAPGKCWMAVVDLYKIVHFTSLQLLLELFNSLQILNMKL